DRGLGERMRTIRHSGREHYRKNADWAASRLRMADDDPRFDGLWNSEVSRAYEDRYGRMKPSQFAGRRLARAWKRHKQKLAAKRVDLASFEDAAVLGLMD